MAAIRFRKYKRHYIPRFPRFVRSILIFIAVLFVMVQLCTFSNFSFCSHNSPVKRVLRQIPIMSAEEMKIHGKASHIQSIVARLESLLADKDDPGLESWPKMLENGSFDETCHYYSKLRNAKRFMIRNFFQSTIAMDENDVTVVAQTSLGRLDRIQTMMKNWGGPVSVAVHVRPAELPTLEQNLMEVVKKISKLELLSLHLVIDQSTTDIYPVNLLRNIAFNGSRTKRLLLLDIDLMCSQGLYEALRNCEMDDKDVIVIPAFEIMDFKKAHITVKDQKDLFTFWKRNIVVPFRSKVWPAGHEATLFEKWKDTTERYQIKYELHFEPYMLIKKTETTPRFDENYMNRYYDRASHTFALYLARYNFSVIPKVFVLHYPHPSMSKKFVKYMGCSVMFWKKTLRFGYLFYPNLTYNLVDKGRRLGKKEADS